MSVFVDDAFLAFGRMTMCHMIADSHEELVGMARKIGIAERWIQYAGTPKEHFDICKAKRELALNHGAIAITWRELSYATVAREKRGCAYELGERMAGEGPSR